MGLLHRFVQELQQRHQREREGSKDTIYIDQKAKYVGQKEQYRKQRLVDQ